MRPIIFLLLLASAPGVGAASSDAITIDVTAPARPFPHYWERMFGSGRANLAMRESYRNDLRAVKAITNFEFVRFHAIFHDENGVYSENAQGQPVYNWSYVDQIYDGLLQNHVGPFVELSFMPSKLAASQVPHAFWYKPLVSPPTDYEKWGKLIEAFTRHLVNRYGLQEVSQWPFEVWNEPNIDFWTGTPKQQTYYELYAAAAKAIKRVNPSLKVGGPATAQAAWVGDMIDYCNKNNLPLDFVSTHVYGNDTADNVFGTKENIPRRDMVCRSVAKVHDEIRKSSHPEMPLYWSEFNASYSNEVDVTDSPFIGPWLANTIRECDGMVQMMSYWTFSDVFEEPGVVKTPFYGGFGLIAAGSIPKASFNDFELLHKLGETRITNSSDSVLVTKRRNGSLAIALWNYVPPEEAGAPRTLHVTLKGLSGSHTLRITTVDAQHGSPLDRWIQMGKPSTPSMAQQRELRQAGKMPAPVQSTWNAAKPIDIQLAPKALALLEVDAH